MDPHKGFIVKRGVLTHLQADRYRTECLDFLKDPDTVYPTIRRYARRDYVWSPHGPVLPGQRTYRIYQALEAPHSDATQAMFKAVLALRDRIERHWIHDPAYRAVKSRLWDYVQATSYAMRSKGIARHRDYTGTLPYPLLQPLIFLSQSGIDYAGGELILHTRGGESINVHRTFQLEKGDAVLFDKSLDHEVTPTEPCGSAGIGRWTVVVGARYPPPPSWPNRVRSLLGAELAIWRARLAELAGPVPRPGS